MKQLAAVLVLAAACSGSSTSSPGPASGSSSPPPPPPPDPTTQPAPIDLAKLGQPCGEGGTCAAGIECVKYYGIAGPRGPELSSCEIRCSEKSACPDGTHCQTIADGPGAVCRPH
jgi:hypothetical protein